MIGKILLNIIIVYSLMAVFYKAEEIINPLGVLVL